MLENRGNDTIQRSLRKVVLAMDIVSWYKLP